MTRFEELQAIINRNKRISKDKISNSQDDPLEVPGITESSKGGNPHMEFATDEQDLPLTEQLYRSGKHKPNDGSGASYWDAE